MDEQDEESEKPGGGGLDPELLKSYLRFVKRAIRAHVVLIALVFVGGVALTVATYKFLPRTYHCETVLMVDGSDVLEGNNGNRWTVLAAAESLIMRHDNLEDIVRKTNLTTEWGRRRPPLLKLKDQIMASIFGPMSEEILMAVLVGTLESRLQVETKQGTLRVSADWSDGATAAAIAEAARESFVKSRHTAEMSAFDEKLAILDGHAAHMRDEIGSMADQARALVTQRAENERAAEFAARSATSASTPVRVAAPPAARPALTTDADLPRFKQELESKRARLAEIERDREQNVQSERRKVEDLKLRLTELHPEVIAAQQKLALLEQPPSNLALLRSEVQSMEGEVRQRELLMKGGVTAPSARGRQSAATPQMLDPLPAEIVELLDAREIDPALAAQLSSAIGKYAALRDEIRSGRIQFDTAQAAFNFRYKLVVPAEAPSKPSKPKPAVVLAGGLLVSLLIALLLPILAELRSGVIVERWQVAMVRLPVLAELRLPPAGGQE